MSLRPEATPTLVAADALIDDALLRALEPAIAALDRLFDAERLSLDDVGDPDGFDGVDHRGALERLLPHEWQLAVDAPDEFLRRFEQGELAYFRLGFVTESQPRTSLVLFDSGPDQLGRPRLAQLATLVVLARRASAAGAAVAVGHAARPRAISGGRPRPSSAFSRLARSSRFAIFPSTHSWTIASSSHRSRVPPSPPGNSCCASEVTTCWPPCTTGGTAGAATRCS